MSLSRALWRGGLWDSQVYANGLWRGGLWNSQRTAVLSELQSLIDDLFGAGQQGWMYESRPVVDGVQVLWEDSSGTVPVTTDGQPVGRRDDISGNAIHASQGTAAAKPIYRTDGTLHWLEGDNVDDVLTGTLTLDDKRWSVVNYYLTSSRDFLLLHRPGENIPWAGIGQSGSASTILAPGNTSQNGFYVDGSLSSATTRGGQYDGAQAGNVVESDFNVAALAGWSSTATGKYAGGSFYTPGRDYGYLLREGGLTASERQDVVAYGKQRAGV